MNWNSTDENTLPKDRQFWGLLKGMGMRRMIWVQFDDEDGAFCEVEDEDEQWKPLWWIEYDALPLPADYRF